MGEREYYNLWIDTAQPRQAEVLESLAQKLKAYDKLGIKTKILDLTDETNERGERLGRTLMISVDDTKAKAYTKREQPQLIYHAGETKKPLKCGHIKALKKAYTNERLLTELLVKEPDGTTKPIGRATLYRHLKAMKSKADEDLF